MLLSACSPGSTDARGSTAVTPTPSPASTLAPAVAPSTTPVSPNTSQDPVVRVVEQVAPAVVNVSTRVAGGGSPFGGDDGTATGTGFIIRPEGIIVTNFHVVEGATRIRVTLPAPDGRSLPARVIGGDSPHDLAVLKVSGRDLPTVPLGDSSELALGQPVVALGYALALKGGPTVTSGIISSLARTIQAQDPNGGENGEGITRTYEDVLQTDAAINPGNSGGPLVDLEGRVIGINSAGVSGAAENIGFSIAINAAKPFLEKAIEDPAEPAAYMGVSTTGVDESVAFQYDLAVDRGALVLDVVPRGPADTAGIVVGDVIVRFDGEPVEGSDELGEMILSKEPGDRVRVEVVRSDGRRDSVTVTLGVRPLP